MPQSPPTGSAFVGLVCRECPRLAVAAHAERLRHLGFGNYAATNAGDDGDPIGDYGETHSASRLYEYQCRRLNTRYKDPVTKKNLFCHALNNTVAASPRILIPIIELYQNADGSITIPTVLRTYMSGKKTIEPASS